MYDYFPCLKLHSNFYVMAYLGAGKSTNGSFPIPLYGTTVWSWSFLSVCHLPVKRSTDHRLSRHIHPAALSAQISETGLTFMLTFTFKTGKVNMSVVLWGSLSWFAYIDEAMKSSR